MNSTVIGPNTIAALRITRWAAWLAVAFLLGVYVTSRAAAEPGLSLTPSAAQPVVASHCGCSATSGTIS